MNRRERQSDRTAPQPASRSAGILLLGGAFVALLCLLVVNRQGNHPQPESTNTSGSAQGTGTASPGTTTFGGRIRPSGIVGDASVVDPAEVVAGKLARFIDGRRDVLLSYASHKGVQIPDEISRFFDLAASKSNRWDEIHEAYLALWKRNRSEPSPELQVLWPVVLETFGVIEAAHEWPAQALLDYGNFVLSSVPPGGVYLGGTDEGRFIPTLLNATDDEPRIVLTQNSLADATYLEYQRFTLRDRLNLPTQAEVDVAFQQIVAEYGKDTGDGRREVGGEAAVMAINSRIVAAMAKANPDRPFAIQESYPMTETYSGATLAGPLYQFQVASGNPGTESGGDSPAVAAGVSPESAVAFWQETASRLALDPEASSGENVRKAYAKLATGQASLLIAQGHTREAEQTLRTALQFTPALPEATFRLVQLLETGGRTPEAVEVVDQAITYATLHPSAMGDSTPSFLKLRQQLATPKP